MTPGRTGPEALGDILRRTGTVSAGLSAKGKPGNERRTGGGPTALLDWALGYARRGWSIVPVRPGTKRAAVKWVRYQAKPPDEMTLQRWFRDGKRDALAVVLGPVSGDLACRDFDQADAYRGWAEEYPDLAKSLPTVRTARGFHVYFRCAGCRLLTLGDGELRGAGCLCLLPPSRHPDGGRYTWAVELPAGALPIVRPAEVGLLGGTVPQKSTEDNRERTESNGRVCSQRDTKVHRTP